MQSFTIDLWEGFTYQGDEKPYRPTLDAYILKSENPRPAVLVLPGSGYFQCAPKESESLAIRFNAAGYHAFVLWYSCAPRRHPLPVLDCSRAVSLIRENAAKWKLDPDRIGLMGFSAGGHLALSQTIFHNRDFAKAPGINPGTSRANALMLCYPVISSGVYGHQDSFKNLLGDPPDPALLKLHSLENQIEKGLPPVFLWHTWTDGPVPVENSLLLALSLKKAGIPMEMHIFPKGEHGLALANHETSEGNPDNIDVLAVKWFDLCLNWLNYYFGVKN
ncbi:MAG: alpha/beta hydrolase [Treponema sp.]|jgi:acetyl esterase/lipase|nr:alpha/beta hydrolase [Treponema sp.]